MECKEPGKKSACQRPGLKQNLRMLYVLKMLRAKCQEMPRLDMEQRCDRVARTVGFVRPWGKRKQALPKRRTRGIRKDVGFEIVKDGRNQDVERVLVMG